MIKSIRRWRREFSRMSKAEQADNLDMILGVGFGVASVIGVLIWILV
jgi:hypothetical protein